MLHVLILYSYILLLTFYICHNTWIRILPKIVNHELGRWKARFPILGVLTKLQKLVRLDRPTLWARKGCWMVAQVGAWVFHGRCWIQIWWVLWYSHVGILKVNTHPGVCHHGGCRGRHHPNDWDSVWEGFFIWMEDGIGDFFCCTLW